ncbi:MAG: HAD-IA family hydrolase [Bdellovibrionota bacterium]
MQKTPLLDLGNVILKVDFQPFLDWLKERAGPANLARAEAFLSSSLFFDFEFGSIGRVDFARRLSDLYGTQITVAEVEKSFCDIFPGPVEGMDELVREMLAEGPVYALSNTNEIHLDWLHQHYPLVKSFTKLYASHEIHMRKPYPGIYRAVADDVGIEPNRLVFFDDIHANVQGAIRAGLEAHVFSGAEHMRTVLKSFK